MGDTRIMFQNMLSFGHSFCDALIQKTRCKTRYQPPVVLSDNYLYAKLNNAFKRDSFIASENNLPIVSYLKKLYKSIRLVGKPFLG